MAGGKGSGGNVDAVRHVRALGETREKLRATQDPVEFGRIMGDHLQRYPDDRETLLGGVTDSMSVRMQECMDEGEKVTLRDLRAIRALSEPEFKTIAAAIAYFVAAESGALRLRREDLFAPDTLVGVVRGIVDDKYMARISAAMELVAAYYLDISMPQNARGVLPLSFSDGPLRDRIIAFVDRPSEDEFRALAPMIVAGQYEEFKRTRENLEIAVMGRVHETYKSMGDLDIPKARRKAIARTGARAAGWIVIVCLAFNISPSSLFDLFRRAPSSKAMASQEVVRAYEEEAARVLAGRANTGVLQIDPDEFERGKKDVVRALDKLKEEHLSHIDQLERVYVVNGQDEMAALAAALSDRALTSNSAEQIQRKVQESVREEGVLSRIGGLFESLTKDTSGADPAREVFSWKTYADAEKRQFQEKVHQNILALLENPEFKTAVAKDLKSGEMELKYVDSLSQAYVQEGKVWVKDISAKAARDLALKGFVGAAGTVKEFFAQCVDYALGSLTGNEQKVDEAERYFSILAAVFAGGAFAVGVLVALGWGLVLTPLVLSVKWTWKGSRLFFKVMIVDQVKDGLVITGHVPIKDLVRQPKPRLDSRTLKVRKAHKFLGHSW